MLRVDIGKYINNSPHSSNLKLKYLCLTLSILNPSPYILSVTEHVTTLNYFAHNDLIVRTPDTRTLWSHAINISRWYAIWFTKKTTHLRVFNGCIVSSRSQHNENRSSGNAFAQSLLSPTWHLSKYSIWILNLFISAIN